MHGTVPSRSDVFAGITSKIVTAIECGARDYVMPWHGGIAAPAFPVNAVTDKAYRGVNVLALWAEASFRRYVSGYWASYRQWQSVNAQVRKGERGSLIVFWKKLEPEDDKGAGDETGVKYQRFAARASYVFNAEQVDGWQQPVRETKSLVQIDAEVASFIEAVGADVRHGFEVARYRHDQDCIEMPSPERFIGASTNLASEAYHAVLLHELTHWSGAPSRLDRQYGKRFGDKAYAFEELIAELGAAFLCSAFRISNEPRLDHAAYVSSWLDVLNRDTKAIFTAASKAQEAVEYLVSLAKFHSDR
jgi:antirestriction protein ArdC